jgi:cytochrome c553
MASRARSLAVLTFLAVACAAPMIAGAQAPAAANAANGQKLAYTCVGCHGIPNYKNMYPAYTVPKLAGQRPEYLVSALKAYKSGERSHGTMHSQASSLSEQDMLDIAAYLAGPQVETKSAPESTNGKKLPEAGALCATCHGGNGVGITELFPSLAGQHSDYLYRAIVDYQKGGRKNPVMAPNVATLKPEEIAAIVEYYSSQKSVLTELKQQKFFFSSK